MSVDLSSMYMVSCSGPLGQNYLTSWTSYAGAGWTTAFNLAKSLGFNTMRIPLGAVTGAFDFPNPTVGELANLTDLCNRAVTAGMRLNFITFDHWGVWGQVTASQTWVSAIIGAIKASTMTITTDPKVSNVIIEVQNEPFWSNPAAYVGAFDTGYPGYPPGPSSPTIGQVVCVWHQQMIPNIRTNFGGPVATCATLYHANAGDLASEIAGLSGVYPDWYYWHCYPNTGGTVPNPTPSVLTADLQSAINVVAASADPGRPLYIGETGLWAAFAGQAAQGNWMQNVRHSCQALGLPEPAPWILYDLPNVAVNQTTYGIFDANSVKRPVGYLYSKYQLGVPNIPAVGSNRMVTVGAARQRLVGPAY